MIKVNYLVSGDFEKIYFHDRNEFFVFYKRKCLEIYKNIVYCVCEGGMYGFAELIEENCDVIEVVGEILELHKKVELDKIREILEKPLIDKEKIEEELTAYNTELTNEFKHGI